MHQVEEDDDGEMYIEEFGASQVGNEVSVEILGCGAYIGLDEEDGKSESGLSSRKKLEYVSYSWWEK